MERKRQLLRSGDMRSVLTRPSELGWIRGGPTEHVFDAAKLLVWLMTLAMLVIDAYNGVLSQPSKTQLQISSYTGQHPFLGVVLPITAFVCLLLVVIDMATYTPRLYTLADFTSSSSIVFDELRHMSMELNNIIGEIESHPPDTYSTLAAAEENLLVEANNYCILDRLRLAIHFRLVLRLVTVVLALSLVAHGLSHAVGGGFLNGLDDDPSFLRHLYFTVTTFFTIGFGDVTPKAGVLAYGFVFLSAILLVVSTSFVIVMGIGSSSDFQTNIRKAAHYYVAGMGRV